MHFCHISSTLACTDFESEQMTKGKRRFETCILLQVGNWREKTIIKWYYDTMIGFSQPAAFSFLWVGCWGWVQDELKTGTAFWESDSVCSEPDPTDQRGTLYFPFPFSHFHFPFSIPSSQFPIPNSHPQPPGPGPGPVPVAWQYPQTKPSLKSRKWICLAP